MSDLTEITQSARAKAEKTIDEVVGAVRAAAEKIGIEAGIPDNVAGHSVSEIVGRIAYIPSMGRDLRRTLGQELTRIYLDELVSGKPINNRPAVQAVDPTTVNVDRLPAGLDLADLDGVTPNCVRALKGAGFTNVGDVAGVPDEHLLKINGIAEKSLQQLRDAISRAAAQASA